MNQSTSEVPFGIQPEKDTSNQSAMHVGIEAVNATVGERRIFVQGESVAETVTVRHT